MRLSLPVLFNRCCRCEVGARNVHFQMIPFGVTRSWSWSTVVTNKIYPGHEGATLLIGSASGNELKNVIMKVLIQKKVKTKRLREVRIGETFKKEMHIAEQVTTLYIIGIPVFRKKELFSD